MTRWVLSSSMVVNVLSFLDWCAHLVFTLTIRLIKTVKWVMDQQLSLTVGHGLSLRTDSKGIAYTRIDHARRFHSQRLCVRSRFSGDDEC